MDKLSVIIPARNEPYLQRTIDSLFTSSAGDIEVIVTLDGYWPDPPIKEDPRLTLIHLSDPVGMRSAINAAARLAKGKYLMKCDAHCLFAEGFDLVLAGDCHHHWVLVPQRYDLEVDTWSRGKKKCTYEYIEYPSFKGRKWPEYDDRVKDKPLANMMTWQGSCWFMHRKRFEYFGGLDEVNYGAMGREAQEISLKAWLSKGRLVLDKNTWYAHWSKPKSTFPSMKDEKQKSMKYCQELWLNNKWSKQRYQLAWLYEKFAPVPSWEGNKGGLDKAASTTPFMSFVTRCYKRPKALQKCVDSIKEQTDQDFEHIFIVDDVGRGIGWANKQFYTHRDEIKGEYVYLVDDDSVIIDRDFVASIKETVLATSADVIMVKQLTASRGIYPTENVWTSHIPVGGEIACGNFCVSNAVYQKHIKSFGRRSAGDFNFIRAVLGDDYKVEWLDRVVMDTERHWGMAEGEMNLHLYFRKKGLIRRRALSPIRVRGYKRSHLYSLFNEMGFEKGAEIGVKRGINARAMCTAIPNLLLILVDPYISYGDDEMELPDAEHNSFYKHARKLLKPYNTRFIIKKSMDAIREVANESLDFVYIDGNHTFDYAMSDIIEWTKKVRPGGIVAGHDYFNWISTNGVVGGVVEAVDTYVRVHGIKELFVTDELSPSFFWMKQQAK